MTTSMMEIERKRFEETVMLREPRYARKKITLKGRQPLVYKLSFPADFIAFIDVSKVDPSKVYVAFNTPHVYVPASKVITARLPIPVITRLLFKWESSEEGKEIEIYYAGAPGIVIGAQIITIGGDYIGLAKETTLSSILSQLDVALSTRASEDTLTQINTKLAQPTVLKSADVVIDNSGGSEDLTRALFTASTPSHYATIYRDPGDSGTVYVGDDTTQVFPFNPGDKIETMMSDLSMIYVRVPAGVVATIHVLWEV